MGSLISSLCEKGAEQGSSQAASGRGLLRHLIDSCRLRGQAQEAFPGSLISLSCGDHGQGDPSLAAAHYTPVQLPSSGLGGHLTCSFCSL